jgi:hypothetical protein
VAPAQPLPQSAPLEAHLEALLAQLEPHGYELQQYGVAEAAYISFLCNVSADDRYNLSLPATLLSRIAAVGAWLDLSV